MWSQFGAITADYLKMVDSESIRKPSTWSINQRMGFSPARIEIDLRIITTGPLIPGKLSHHPLWLKMICCCSVVLDIACYTMVVSPYRIGSATQSNAVTPTLLTNSVLAFLKWFSVLCTTRAMIEPRLKNSLLCEPKWKREQINSNTTYQASDSTQTNLIQVRPWKSRPPAYKS